MSQQIAYWGLWALCLGLTAVCWRFGGEPERRGALMLALAYAASLLFPHVRFEGMKVVVMLVDLLLALGLLWLALTRRRWWVLVAAANAILVVIAHATIFMDESIHQRAYIAYRMLPGLVIPIAAGLGAWERWLAGERPFKGWLSFTPA